MTPIWIALVEDETWETENVVEYDDAENECKLIIPAKYRFDLASVPRFAWRAIAPFELSILAPLLHDYIYDWKGQLPESSVIPHRTYTRYEADRLFLYVMRHEGVKRWRRTLAYLAVRCFGWIYWNRKRS